MPSQIVGLAEVWETGSPGRLRTTTVISRPLGGWLTINTPSLSADASVLDYAFFLFFAIKLLGKPSVVLLCWSPKQQ